MHILQDNIRFLEEHGGAFGSQAHILQDSQGNLYLHIGPQEPETPGCTTGALASGQEEIDLEALIAQVAIMSRDGDDDDTVLAVARAYARRFTGAGRPQRGAPARGA